ncbi:MAG TPA: hypothetical protein VKS22_14735 [Candidatus Binataceae bacterium]|nr:hypothetical protein [Candidatus Binataceae bacterium]
MIAMYAIVATVFLIYFAFWVRLILVLPAIALAIIYWRLVLDPEAPAPVAIQAYPICRMTKMPASGFSAKYENPASPIFLATGIRY